MAGYNIFSTFVAVWFLSIIVLTIGEENSTNCGVDVEYVGNSGQFKLQFCSTSFIKIKMESLTEIDLYGKKTNNKVTSFAGNQESDWLSQDGDNSTYQDLSAVTNTYVSILSVGTGNPSLRAQVPFNLTTILFLESGIISVNDEDESVDETSLKWTISIDDWPFEHENNTLELCMSITSGGNDDQSDSDSDSNDDNEYNNITVTDNGDSLTLGDFNLILPEMVELDGELVNGVSINYDNNKQFCWIFNYFDQTLLYDPIVRIGDGSDNEINEPNDTTKPNDTNGSNNTNEPNQTNQPGEDDSGVLIVTVNTKLSLSLFIVISCLFNYQF